MEQPPSDWFLTWWTPISVAVGAVISYIITFVSLRRQFFDHLKAYGADQAALDKRLTQDQLALDRRLMQMHSDNTKRLDDIQGDMRELRRIMLDGGRYRGPERAR